MPYRKAMMLPIVHAFGHQDDNNNRRGRELTLPLVVPVPGANAGLGLDRLHSEYIQVLAGSVYWG